MYFVNKLYVYLQRFKEDIYFSYLNSMMPVAVIGHLYGVFFVCLFVCFVLGFFAWKKTIIKLPVFQKYFNQISNFVDVHPEI